MSDEVQNGSEATEKISVGHGDADLSAAIGRIIKQGGVQPQQPAAQPAAKPVAAPKAAATGPAPVVLPQTAPIAQPSNIDSNILDFVEPAPDIIGVNEPAVASSPKPVLPSNELSADTEIVPQEVKTNPKAAKAWEITKKENRTLKAELEAARAKEREFQKQLEEAKAQKGVKELELLKRNEELETEVGRYSLRSTKAFQEKYVRPVNAELQKAVTVLQRTGMPVEEAKNTVNKLRSIQDMTELEAALSDLPRFAQGVVSNAIYSAQEIERTGLEAMDNWKQTKAALDAESSQVEEVAFKKALVHDTTEAAKELADKFDSWAFRPDPGNQKFMEQREQMVLHAQHVLQNGTEREFARLALDGVASPYYRKWGAMWREKALALQAELEAREASYPRLGSGGQIEAPPPAKPEPKKPISLETGISQVFKEHGFGG